MSNQVSMVVMLSRVSANQLKSYAELLIGHTYSLQETAFLSPGNHRQAVLCTLLMTPIDKGS